MCKKLKCDPWIRMYYFKMILQNITWIYRGMYRAIQQTLRYIDELGQHLYLSDSLTQTLN